MKHSVTYCIRKPSIFCGRPNRVNRAWWWNRRWGCIVGITKWKMWFSRIAYMRPVRSDF